ncbi:Gfo/Idh/MocA family protein [Paenibacillus pini]|uniref:Oxidoreductase n=1 Tax=Paenibacillus pini JCM 16418 TaxID=1236976 RepID=W7YIU8_9BACL|nr:Gfo/Idh/MocA family oxidoreductase [Paenibacillus pini]GAF08387.1 oxidoreductase [Paenibacillus pini JCM 16418]
MKVALIGYGYWGKIIRRYIERSEALQLELIYDRHPQEDKIFTNHMNHILLNNEIELVFICTPTHTHYEYCKLCLTNHKHVFCEKPLVTDYSQAVELTRLAESNQKILYTDYIYTVSKSIQSMKTFKEQVGDILAIEGRIEQFGNFYRDEHVYEIIGVHLISAILYILEGYDRITHVDFTDMVTNEAGFCNIGNIQMNIDHISVEVHCNLLAIRKVRTLRLIGSKGMLHFDMMRSPNVELIRFEQEEHAYRMIESKQWTFDEMNNVEYAIQECVQFILDGNVNSNHALALEVTKVIHEGRYM